MVNGLGLKAGGQLELLHCQPPQKYIKSTKLYKPTNAHLILAHVTTSGSVLRCSVHKDFSVFSFASLSDRNAFLSVGNERSGKI